MQFGKMSSNPDEFIQEILQFSESMRKCVIADGIAISKTVNGQVTGNFINLQQQKNKLRKPEAEQTILSINKKTTPEFNLYIKHPSAFTALIEPLRSKFSLFACIRSPLAVLAAWQTVDFPVNRGRIPAAERFSPNLKMHLDAEPDTLARQVHLMRWFLESYTTLPAERILRFEDLTKDPHSALSKICPSNTATGLSLEVTDPAVRYPFVDVDRLRHALRPLNDLVLHHYPEGLPY